MKKISVACFFLLGICPLLAQVPAITDFTPKSGEVGSTVTITGINFSTTPANNTVYFGGAKATVSGATATELKVAVPSGATFNLLTVTVNALTAYSKTPFHLTFPSNLTFESTTFSSKFNISTGSATFPYFIISFDVDGDGKSDVIARNTNNTVSVFRNTSTIGAVSFAAKTDLSVPATASNNYKILFADMDGDSKLDIVGSNFIIRNTAVPGNIPVTMPVTSLVSFGAETDFEVNDMNLDGKPDYIFLFAAASSGNCTSGKIIKTLRNKSTAGNISFNTPTLFEDNYCQDGFSIYGQNENVNYLTVSDFDNNGFPDYASIKVLGDSPEGSVNLNTYDKSPGGGGDPRLSGTSYVRFRLFSADIDGDDKVDIITAGRPVAGASIYGIMSVYKNASVFKRTAFNNAVSFNALGYSSTTNFCIANLDGNDKPDFLSFNENTTSNVLGINQNKSQSGFIAFAPLQTFDLLTNTPKGVAAVDIDGDNKTDILLANGDKSSFTVLLNQIKYIEGANFIEGKSDVCASQKNIVFSVPIVKGADSYEWVVPTGITIKSGNTTRSITIDIENNAPLQGEIKVRGLSGNVKGDFSPTFIYNILATPIPPANLKTLVSSAASVSLTWDDKSANETEFFIYRAKNRDSSFVLLDKRNKDITTYTDNFDLQPNNTYFYHIAAANGECLSAFSNTSGVTIPPATITALYPGISDKDVFLSPNPSDGVFEIKSVRFSSEKVQVRVSDALGNLIFQESAKSLTQTGKYLLDLHQAAPGIYFLMLVTENGNISKKLIKQ